MKKNLKQKLLKIQFPTKNSVGARVCFSPEWSKGARKIVMFEIVKYTETGGGGTG